MKTIIQPKKHHPAYDAELRKIVREARKTVSLKYPAPKTVYTRLQSITKVDHGPCKLVGKGVGEVVSIAHVYSDKRVQVSSGDVYEVVPWERSGIKGKKKADFVAVC